MSADEITAAYRAGRDLGRAEAAAAIAGLIDARSDGAGRLIRSPEQTRLCHSDSHDDRWCSDCDLMEMGMDIAARIARDYADEVAL